MNGTGIKSSFHFELGILIAFGEINTFVHVANANLNYYKANIHG